MVEALTQARTGATRASEPDGPARAGGGSAPARLQPTDKRTRDPTRAGAGPARGRQGRQRRRPGALGRARGMADARAALARGQPRTRGCLRGRQARRMKRRRQTRRTRQCSTSEREARRQLKKEAVSLPSLVVLGREQAAARDGRRAAAPRGPAEQWHAWRMAGAVDGGGSAPRGAGPPSGERGRPARADTWRTRSG